ncbi:metalloregulator ArsR/SmtB family transcription factor [uncultured Pelagimonas sp.]|uniref:ArsR/SmtB family transcription factor n=1 Tax=uncultured Pelagimonas sp. TaxID=1618102 RepID=UPI002604A54D|nr:metalloregulator ArsR/SmtB family transcription factor [uncultured Pelagimonas sp.]
MDAESSAKVFAALSSPVRLQIMLWILDPRSHFPPQIDGDLVRDGVCVGAITEKTGLSQPTISSHMKKLAAAGLVRGQKFGNWMFYKPDRAMLGRYGGVFSELAAYQPE